MSNIADQMKKEMLERRAKAAEALANHVQKEIEIYENKGFDKVKYHDIDMWLDSELDELEDAARDILYKRREKYED